MSLVPLGSAATAAEIDWCASDPVFSVDGTTFHLTAYWPRSQTAAVYGVTYVISVPADAEVGYAIPAGETTSVRVVWERTGRDGISATATVNASDSFITKLDLGDADRTVYGQSNRPMTIVVAGGRSGG